MLPNDKAQRPEPAELPDSPVQTPGHMYVGPSPAEPIRIKPTRLWICTLGAGLVAGLIAWGVGEATYGLFQWNDAKDVLKAYPAELKKLGPNEQREFITKKMIEARSRAESRNTAIAFGVLGAVLGLALGRAGGLVTGSSRSGARAGWIGFAVAGALGAVMAFPVVPLYYKYLFRLRLDRPVSHSCRTAASAGCRLWVCSRDRPGWTADGRPRDAVGHHGGFDCRPCLRHG